MRIPIIMLTIGTFYACHKQDRLIVSTNTKPQYALVIHGGAGTITKNNMTPELEIEYAKALSNALLAGETLLKNGHSAVEAVEAAIRSMEDSPLFNAGKGSVFTHEGKNELDASIMDGATGNAGAVGALTIIKNPISAAIAVMRHSQHVMLVGKGAEDFCREKGIELVDPSYFYTERRWKSLQQTIQHEQGVKLSESDLLEKKKGTVGCVALDQFGNLAAGTSTGGMTNKKYGRIGDSPIIGAGTYADNSTCGVSCTGHGEFFIRNTVARDVAAMMEYGGKTCIEAAKYLIHDKLKNLGGEGGLIAIDKSGNIIMEFNSEGMYRGYVTPEKKEVKIYKN
ncbi:MAG: isoaspartyl peptidase/L-asparaginase [Saprospiraceae bacterium]|nr:isoaspartyl peptidase/L-asparaginase [Saprospiraceae bacterium]MBK7789711.1 isoaspartyl peptidase/L-asparaginase [Saprospiraceae bacterium]MBK8851009.1 isoaspartyl peptidase/L-asparaginase [Saprospiraceae bacterium]MBL0082604.1 isoaspartyl peptidase/L-asparaginase [Saprospiraceae bacterium]